MKKYIAITETRTIPYDDYLAKTQDLGSYFKVKDAAREGAIMPAKFSEKVSRDPRDLIFMPDRAYIERLAVGDLARNCFGSLDRIVEITFRGEDSDGHMYVGYYTRFGRDGRVSHSIKQDRIDRTIALTNRYSAADIDALERLTNWEE
jgi:hypothetical protein